MKMTRGFPRELVALIVLGLLSASLVPAQAQRRARTELGFSSLPGYLTLKCDLHMHTIFSDGLVWPTVRVAEAWRDGFDAIAVTDHIEYLPHRSDCGTNYNRSYELALAAAKPLGLLLIKAAEITRGEPPGHWNAVFLKEIEPLKTTNYLDALKAAVDQGAFIFWNHPGWKQPNQKSVWYDEQQEVYERGWLKGLEVVNGDDYDPIVHQWCVDKQLVPIGNSDLHSPVDFDYDRTGIEHRPVTLVFAKAKTEEAVKEALFAGRTAVYTSNLVVGQAEYLRPLFERSLELKTPRVAIKGKGKALLQVHNRAPVNFLLEREGRVAEVSLPKNVTLWAGKTSLLEISAKTNNLSGAKSLGLPFRVLNLRPAPDQNLPVRIKVKVDFTP